ncbi:MAG: hypothetical protein HUU20_28575 [Pirellulales bacterium]|nr:hypothetical protein [Pirellulales bacterium]
MVSRPKDPRQEGTFLLDTYFVGESGLLVHDNTPEQPTDALVPGLMAL